MTIKVTIKNEDSRESAIINVTQEYDNSGNALATNLKGGESIERHLTADSKLSITEIQNG